MPRFPSELVPHRLPLVGSIGAPWGPLMPSRSHGTLAPTEMLGTVDNSTDWDPYNGGDNVHMAPAQAAAPLPSRPSIGQPYVTPMALWNVAGPSGLDQGEWPIIRKDPQGGRYYQFGFQTPGQAPWAQHHQVRLSLPSVPPPMPFLGTGL